MRWLFVLILLFVATLMLENAESALHTRITRIEKSMKLIGIKSGDHGAKKSSNGAKKTGNASFIIDDAISNLTKELHLPGYHFCGPGTKLAIRLRRGDRGINKLDEACMHHDIAYNNTDLKVRHEADLKLLKVAKNRLKSKDATEGEKVSAWLVQNSMVVKIKAYLAQINEIKLLKTTIKQHFK